MTNQQIKRAVYGKAARVLRDIYENGDLGPDEMPIADSSEALSTFESMMDKLIEGLEEKA